MCEINRDKQGNGFPAYPLSKQLGADFSQIAFYTLETVGDLSAVVSKA